jgi:DNA mismatch repair ATPase MutS
MKPFFFTRWKFDFPDTLLLFEMELNYACFHADAEAAAQALGVPLIAVVNDSERIPTVVIRRESRDRSVERLEAAGHRVLVCAAPEKGSTRRRVA